jgi:hypothetical protein
MSMLPTPRDWLKMNGEKLLRIADESLPYLKHDDAEAMQQYRREAKDMLDRLLAALSTTNPADELSVYIAALIDKALAIGVMMPAVSESAKATLAAGRARHAREGKAKGEKLTTRNVEIEAATADWDGSHPSPWTLARRLEGKPGIGLKRRAIFDRLKKLQKPQL